jgi:hypothetical protein
MLSSVRTAWPPEPGLEQTTTGYKQFIGDVAGVHSEDLGGLHEPAWWTGVRVYAPGDPRVCSMRLVCEGGSLGPAFEWTQLTGVWTAFPWPIAAHIGKAMGLRLEVRFTEEEAIPVSLRVCFHEMPDMPNDVPYLFFDTNGFAVAAWNASQREFVLRGSAEAAWNSIHYLVPKMVRLLTSPSWDDDRLVCFHNWSERVPT